MQMDKQKTKLDYMLQKYKKQCEENTKTLEKWTSKKLKIK